MLKKIKNIYWKAILPVMAAPFIPLQAWAAMSIEDVRNPLDWVKLLIERGMEEPIVVAIFAAIGAGLFCVGLFIIFENWHNKQWKAVGKGVVLSIVGAAFVAILVEFANLAGS